MKIKLYKCVTNSIVYVTKETYFKGYDDDNRYVSASEPIDVNFKMIDENEVVKNEVACINNQIKSEMADSEVRLNLLKQQKQELLSIEFNGDSNDTNI